RTRGGSRSGTRRPRARRRPEPRAADRPGGTRARWAWTKGKGERPPGPLPPSYRQACAASALQVVVHELGHLEHRDLRAPAEDRLQLVVGVDLPLVALVLELVGLDVV